MSGRPDAPSMKTLLLAAALLSARFATAGPLPDELVGIWAPENAEFRGDMLLKGQAVYLDSDGVGGVIAGFGRSVIGARLVVTSFDPARRALAFQITERGKVAGTGRFVYDRTRRVLVSDDDKKTYTLRKPGSLAAGTRQALGLEPRR